MIELAQQFIADRLTEYRTRLTEVEVLRALNRDIWRTREKVMEIIARRRELHQKEPLFKDAWLWDPTGDCEGFLIDLIDEGSVETRELKTNARSTSRLELTETDLKRLAEIHACHARRSFLPVYKLSKERPRGGNGRKIWDFFSFEAPAPALALVPR